jgi:hypothetical protein
VSYVTTDPAAPLPPPGGTQVVLLPTQGQPVFTLVRETDCRTAMTRGLQEYLQQLTIDWPDGRQERFAAVFDTWAESEDRLQYPSAAVYSVEEMTYDAGSLSPATETDPATNTQYTHPSEAMLQMTVELWCQDPEQRMAVIAMLEDAFNPVEWMAGFRLILPHYHGMVATYMPPAGMTYMDTEEDAKRRYRKAVFTISGRVPQVRVLGPGVPMRNRAQLTFNAETHPARVAGVAPYTTPADPTE